MQVCVSLSLEVEGLELPDVQWATCLSGPNIGTSPLTAEINQSQGNLYSKTRKEHMCAYFYLWEDEYFKYIICCMKIRDLLGDSL